MSNWRYFHHQLHLDAKFLTEHRDLLRPSQARALDVVLAWMSADTPRKSPHINGATLSAAAAEVRRRLNLPVPASHQPLR